MCGVLDLIGALYGQSGFNLGNLITHARASSPDSYTATCQKIEASISSASQVFYPGEFQCDFEELPLLFITFNSGYLASQNFDSDISHWANSSSQVPVCSVEPGTPTDVGLIVSWSLYQCTLPILLITFDANTTTASTDRPRSSAICSQRWWTCYQSRILVNLRRTHIHDPIQGYCHPRRFVDGRYWGRVDLD
jgi:hypothetical protein